MAHCGLVIVCYGPMLLATGMWNVLQLVLVLKQLYARSYYCYMGTAQMTREMNSSHVCLTTMWMTICLVLIVSAQQRHSRHIAELVWKLPTAHTHTEMTKDLLTIHLSHYLLSTYLCLFGHKKCSSRVLYLHGFTQNVFFPLLTTYIVLLPWLLP